VAFVENRQTWVAWRTHLVTDAALRRTADEVQRRAGGCWVRRQEVAALLGVNPATLTTLRLFRDAPKAQGGFPDYWITTAQWEALEALAARTATLTPWQARRYVAAQLRAQQS
jgi:hypothetical protein